MTPAWQELHDDWWDERREPQPGDLEAAWDALWEVVPAGWTVARPQQDLHSGQWNVSAVKVSGTASESATSAGPTCPAGGTSRGATPERWATMLGANPSDAQESDTHRDGSGAGRKSRS